MWIRMTHTAAGPRLPHCLNAGATYRVEDELGEELVKERAAVEVADPTPKPKEAARPVEVAAVDDGETAVNPDAEKKAESLMDKLKKPPAEADAAKKPAAKADSAKK